MTYISRTHSPQNNVASHSYFHGKMDKNSTRSTIEEQTTWENGFLTVQATIHFNSVSFTLSLALCWHAKWIYQKWVMFVGYSNEKRNWLTWHNLLLGVVAFRGKRQMREWERLYVEETIKWLCGLCNQKFWLLFRRSIFILCIFPLATELSSRMI